MRLNSAINLSNQPQFKTALIVILLLAILFPFSVLGQTDSSNLDTRRYGQIDFVEYWSAFRLVKAGKNPYSPVEMRDFQKEHLNRDSPLMMWNPPWLLLVMYPVLVFDFETSSKIWLAIQSLLIAIGALLIIFSINKNYQSSNLISTIIVFLSSLTFVPIYNSLQLGQIGGLLFFGFACFQRGVINQSKILLIIGIILLSLKPHLFLILAVIFTWSTLKKSDWATITTAFLAICILFITSEMYLTGYNSAWINSFFQENNTGIVPRATDWLTCNFAGALRAYGNIGFWLSLIITPIIALILLIYCILREAKGNVHSELYFALWISVFFAPFGWFFDYVVLLPIYILTLTAAVNNKNWKIFFLLLVYQAAMYAYIKYIFEFQHELWWYSPVLMLFLFVAIYRKEYTSEKLSIS